MSTSLYWSRVPVELKEESLYSLKRALAKKIWDSDGEMGENIVVVGHELIPFLEGIVEGNGSGDMGRDAKKLIDAINEYGKVQLCIHYVTCK